jgi:2'-5' RNA ligase
MDWSALVIRVPGTPSVFEAYRLRHDPAAALGVPAHITVLSPFLNPQDITEATVAQLGTLFSRLPKVAFSFYGTDAFAGGDEEILYVVPDPDAPLRELTESVSRQYRMCPPYGGAYSAVVPHLTLGRVPPAPSFHALRSEFSILSESCLPLHCEAPEVTLLVGNEESCVERSHFRLGG